MDGTASGDKRQRFLHLYKGGRISGGSRGRREITRVCIGPRVKKIPHGTFNGCINLAEVQFSYGLKVIEDRSFLKCKALQQVTIPSTVTRLGHEAFRRCTNLTQVHFNESLRSIGDSAFRDCKSLQQVTIPSSVTKLGDGLFRNCCKLTKVHFNDGLQIIESGAFYGCKALQHVAIPSSVTKLGRFAFGGCTNLAEVIVLRGNRFINQEFIDHGLFSGEGALNKKRVKKLISVKTLRDCPLTTLKISIPPALSLRMARLPQEYRLSVEGRIHDMRRLELTPDGTILACFPIVRRLDVEDTDNQTTESLHEVLRLIPFYELKESSILIELAMWKSRLDGDRARADCRIAVPDPAKSLIMEYCGFTKLLEPAIEGAQ